MICEVIIKAQNKPKSSDFLFSSATWAVKAPWATQSTEAEIPQIIAPKMTMTHTSPWGRGAFVTINNPVA